MIDRMLINNDINLAMVARDRVSGLVINGKRAFAISFVTEESTTVLTLRSYRGQSSESRGPTTEFGLCYVSGTKQQIGMVTTLIGGSQSAVSKVQVANGDWIVAVGGGLFELCRVGGHGESR